jgi:hypothetical protein
MVGGVDEKFNGDEECHENKECEETCKPKRAHMRSKAARAHNEMR